MYLRTQQNNILKGAKEIKGFPGYLMNPKTEEVISMRQGIRILQVTVRSNVPMVTLYRDNRQRAVSLNRLVYAVQNNIDYDIIPQDVFVIRKEDGSFSLSNASDMVRFPQVSSRKDRSENRLQYIDRKIERLQIMRRLYESGDYKEAVSYIERYRKYLIDIFIRRHNCKYERAELVYSEAVEAFVRNVQMKSSQVTDMVEYVRGLMSKVKKRHSIYVRMEERK